METQTRLTAKEQMICQSIKQQIIDMTIEGSMDSDMTQLDVETLYANALEINKEAINFENAIENASHYLSCDYSEIRDVLLQLEKIYEDTEFQYDFCTNHDIPMWQQTEHLTIEELYDLVF
jgi:hypothetical protein